MFKTSRRLEIGVGSTQISRLQGSAGLRLPLSRALPHNARRKRPPRQRACERQGDTAHAPLPDGSREGGAGPRPAGAGKMAAAAVAANGTGGSSGMEVDAAGNGPRGGSFRRQPSGYIKAAFLNPGRSREGGCNVAPWDNVLEGCMAQALPSRTLNLLGRTWGPDSHPLSFSPTYSSPQRDGLRSDWECFSCSSSPCHSQHLRPLDSHALPGGEAYAG